ncbi:MAG: hypothetical protein P8M28_04020, partial [Alphaproteobacteria bacterium]|nr:hypothetical protein [Alphaproteobacteria bacterium]
MNQTGLGAVGNLARRVVPGLTILFLVLLAHLHLPFSFYVEIAPALPLMGIYYWVVFRPDLMPRIMIFAIGL